MSVDMARKGLLEEALQEGRVMTVLEVGFSVEGGIPV